LFRRITAWAVVPEPEKKSTIVASGLPAIKKRSVSSTAYRDFGYGKALAGRMELSKIDPWRVAS
jgi:hypothetical protein